MSKSAKRGTVKLRIIVIDPNYQIRKKVDPSAVIRYAEAMGRGDKFPELVLEKKTNKLICGWTRYWAYMRAFDPNYEVSVRWVEFRDDAERMLYAAEDNARHGYPLEPWDMKLLIMSLTEKGVSSNKIAERLRMTQQRVEKMADINVAIVGRRPRSDEVRKPEAEVREMKRSPTKQSVRFLAGREVSESVLDNIDRHYIGINTTTLANQLIMRMQDDTINRSNEAEIDSLKRLYEALGSFLGELKAKAS